MSFKAFIHQHVVIQTVRTFAWVFAVLATGTGASLILSVPEIVRRPTFDANFIFAPPHIWGIGYLVFAGWLTVTLLRNARAAALPLYGLAILICIWGAFTFPSAEHGSIIVIWAYSALGVLCLITGLSLGEQHEARP